MLHEVLSSEYQEKSRQGLHTTLSHFIHFIHFIHYSYSLQDSPTNKLLFARDIPRYRKWVERFYKEVAEAPPVSDHEMCQAMTDISMVGSHQAKSYLKRG